MMAQCRTGMFCIRNYLSGTGSGTGAGQVVAPRIRSATYLSYIGCALLMLASAANGATWYVSTNGNDAAAGTGWGSAFRTIQRAVQGGIGVFCIQNHLCTINENDTISVTNGVYAPISIDNKSVL